LRILTFIMSVTYLDALPSELQTHIDLFVPGSFGWYRMVVRRIAKVCRGRSFGYCAKCGKPHIKAETCGQYYNKLRVVRECAIWEIVDHDQGSSIFVASIRRRHLDLVYLEAREDLEAVYPNVTNIISCRCEVTVRPMDNTGKNLWRLCKPGKSPTLGDLKNLVVENFLPPGIYY